MHFCKVCQNMYYIRIEAENINRLIYYCRNCGDEDDKESMNNVVITHTNLKKSNQEFGHIINQYTKLDPTLPRINNVLCPNVDCLTNTDPNNNPREIIYIRYDDINMKYVSLCSTCDIVWKTEEHK
jgi:DNA-directed RNA polymerase subunit M/transcription elongation factor TFIIS